MGKRSNKEKNKRRAAVVLIALLLFAAAVPASVFAYLKLSGYNVKNSFNPDSTEKPFVSEKFENTVKENVRVNVGATDYSVYVRAAVVVTWKNDSGNIYSLNPVNGMDYKIEYALSQDGWFRGDDGFYYYSPPVQSGGTTTELIKRCTQLRNSPDGYFLDVQIVAQTVQSAGTTDMDSDGKEIPAVADAWGVEIDESGNIVQKN